MNIDFDRTILTAGEEETEEFGRALAMALAPGAVVALQGDLGAGKTVLARGFARGLGVTEPVSSPTYTIMQEYPLPGGRGYLYHLDLYRLDGVPAALAFGVDEYLDDPDSYLLAEWPERIAPILPPGTVTVTIVGRDDGRREISLKRSR